MIPIVLPLNSKLPFASLFHTPLWAALFLSKILRINKMEAPITNSATLLVLLYGALKTAMPFCLQAFKST